MACYSLCSVLIIHTIFNGLDKILRSQQRHKGEIELFFSYVNVLCVIVKYVD